MWPFRAGNYTPKPGSLTFGYQPYARSSHVAAIRPVPFPVYRPDPFQRTGWRRNSRPLPNCRAPIFRHLTRIASARQAIVKFSSPAAHKALPHYGVAIIAGPIHYRANRKRLLGQLARKCPASCSENLVVKAEIKPAIELALTAGPPCPLTGGHSPSLLAPCMVCK